ncbi:Ig-like domain-containing protein [Lederbergia wuyishanensis]|uniref:Bacterial Ig domain-containing protein n=1 Tax=Lederbergia wuyishanensis TaxID=1347903 RepID=A0ABU0D2Y8_9BACI|nr:Ig-like domain-containing protein [Lederbergia wuyishanensis]MCJ8007109.1 Ig-like domain-containing protein [Lederbergia wuyishanensis]MDQ0342746.1 hypothetical protein [Lederbergia wuyishanensis]
MNSNKYLSTIKQNVNVSQLFYNNGLFAIYTVGEKTFLEYIDDYDVGSPKIVKSSYHSSGNENEFINGMDNIPLDSSFSFQFNQQGINLADESKITMEGPDGLLNIDCDVKEGRLLIKPENLKENAIYTITINKGSITNYLGEFAEHNITFNFKTFIPPVSKISVEVDRSKSPDQYTITAVATGGVEPEYKFLIRENDKWEVLQDYSPNNVIVWNPTKDGWFEFYVHARSSGQRNDYDQAYYFGEFVVDTIFPEITITPNVIGMTNGNVVLNIKASDNFGIKSIWVPNKYVNSSNTTFTVTSNGTYTFEAIDMANNVTRKSITITNIDKLPPALGLSQNIVIPTNKDVIITVNALDNVKVKRIILPDGSITTKNSTKFTVSKNGTYKFSAEDTAGNVTTRSLTVANINKVPPPIPTVNPIWDSHTVIKGKAKSNVTVYAKNGSKTIGSAKASAKGDYKITIAKQKAGNKILVHAKDSVGNVSKTKSVIVIDKTPPLAPIVNKVTSKAKVVSGKGEKGATVYVYRGKKYLNKGTVDSKGNFRIKISQQKKGSILSVYAVDKAKNKSKITKITVK